MTTTQQDRLIDFAAHNYTHAELRDEADVAVFIEIAFPPTDRDPRRVSCEIECVSTMAELRAVLGY